MQIYDDLIFPDEIVAMAARGKRRRKTDVATDQAGFAKSNVVWQRTLREYELGLVARPVPQWEQIAALHEVVDGRAYGFLLRDPTDSRAAAGEGVLRPLSPAGAALGTNGFGYGVPTYRTAKRYTFLTRSKDSDVSMLQTGTVAITRGGSPVLFGSGAGNVSASATTGLVTFVPDAQQGVSAVTVGATTAITLAGTVGLSVGQRLWLQDLTGTHASLLNNLSHAITSVVGNVYTVSTNTSGKTITAAGTGRKYPQASEALAWTGNFYIPVAFDSDDLDWQMVAGSDNEDNRLVMGPSVKLVEVRLP